MPSKSKDAEEQRCEIRYFFRPDLGKFTASYYYCGVFSTMVAIEEDERMCAAIAAEWKDNHRSPRASDWPVIKTETPDFFAKPLSESGFPTCRTCGHWKEATITDRGGMDVEGRACALLQDEVARLDYDGSLRWNNSFVTQETFGCLNHTLWEEFFAPRSFKPATEAEG